MSSRAAAVIWKLVSGDNDVALKLSQSYGEMWACSHVKRCRGRDGVISLICFPCNDLFMGAIFYHVSQ
jgi:hypothetical protein